MDESTRGIPTCPCFTTVSLNCVWINNWKYKETKIIAGNKLIVNAIKQMLSLLPDIYTLPFIQIRYVIKMFGASLLESLRIQLVPNWHGDNYRCIGLQLYPNLGKDPLRWVQSYNRPLLIFPLNLIIKVINI